MKTIVVLDRLINKHITITNVPDEMVFAHRQKVIYRFLDDPKELVGVYVGFDVQTEKTGTFIAPLEGKESEQFDQYQQKAKNLFPIFKREFKKHFHPVTPVSARMNLQGTQVYFYFYSEQRFVFTDFIKNFRNQIGMNFFLFQVGARDMVRLSYDADIYLAACGCGPLGCAGVGPLPSVEMDNIVLQGLEGRDAEKLKGRCGKLKCSIIFERALYLEEMKRYPNKGDIVTIDGQDLRCGGSNIMNGEVMLFGNEGMKKINIKDIPENARKRVIDKVHHHTSGSDNTHHN